MLAPRNEVRLRCAYSITCKEVQKDENGNITTLLCTYDPDSRGGGTPYNRKVKGTLHWVSASHAVEAEVRLYDQLFLKDNPNDVEEGQSFLDSLNPDSLKTVTALVDPSLAKLSAGDRVQFERLGYFCADSDYTPERPVFNRTATLKDTWAKLEQKS